MFTRILFAVLFLFAAGAAAAPVIMVFGDSLSSGYGLPRDSSWVSHLQRQLQREKYDYKVVNASISGETTLGGRTRIESAVKTHQPAIVIVELGGNDGLRGFPVETVRDNLDAIIQALYKHESLVLLVGIRVPPNYGPDYARKFQSMFSGLSKRYKLPLVPFMLEGFGDKREYFQADNIHPNMEAQPLILDNIWKQLQPMLKK